MLDDLRQDARALLAGRGGGLPELFYLPLRIAKVLGWVAAAPDLYPADDARAKAAETQFADLLHLLLHHYKGSILAMSDAQAPYWAVAISRAARLHLDDEVDELVGLLFHSLVACRARLARWDIPSESVLDYLLARHEKDYSKVGDLVARPNETLTVLTKVAPIVGLDEVLDYDLWRLDGIPFSAYVNPVFSEYGKEVMERGENVIWSIGHDIFRVADLARSWPTAGPTPPSFAERASVVLAALLYPDRVPWLCLDSPLKPFEGKE